MKKFLEDFKKFISRGNIIDLAVGVVVGGAFSKIVTSLVNDIIMPLIGIIIGGHDFSNFSIKVGNAKIMYGSFIQNIIDFLIISFCIFLGIKIMNKLLKHNKEKETKKEEKKDENIILLTEIRDLLKQKQ